MKNKPEYMLWIKGNVPDPCKGMCVAITLLMKEAFPELIRVRGHYICMLSGQHTHWWLKTEDGLIIDPTVSQFPSHGDGIYVEHDENEPEPLGRCYNCGEYYYEYHGGCCSEACHNAYAKFCMEELNKDIT